jgi:YVTN family beta-propeller protein
VINTEKKILNLRTAAKNLTLLSICKTTSNKVLGTVYHNRTGDGLNNKVVVFKDGEIKKIIDFGKKHGPDYIISDAEKGLSYIGFVLQPARYNPEGTPYYILKEDVKYKWFALKGSCRTYCIGEENIYAFVTAFKELGYKNIPENYLATINRDTQEVKITNDSIGLPFSCDYIPNKEEIWTLYSDINNNWNSKICIYNKDGTVKKEFNLETIRANRILINKNGLAYISHGDYMGKANCINAITIHDTNTQKYIGKIDMPKGPMTISEMDNYLFVSNSPSNSVSIIDTSSNKLIYTIENITDDYSSIDENVVIKP